MGAGELLGDLRAAAAEAGARAWAVGGFVRDHLLGRDHPDLDVVVEEGRGLEVAEAFARGLGARPPVVFPRFGTAQVTLPDGRLVEFASARQESYARQSRKPEVRPASLEEDLRRRDFTVNALLMDLDGNVHDPLGRGLQDLRERRLRTPLDPRVTFDDDPLRMLRAVRFAVQLDFELDGALLPAMRELRERARPPVLSAERVRDELEKMLVSPRPDRALELLEAGGLLEVVLPEIQAERGVEQKGWHTHDVLGHTMLAVAASKPDLLGRLAALFHDVGKPVTAAGDGTFLGHEVQGVPIAEAALRRLRFSNATVDRVGRLVRLHMRPVYYDQGWTDAAVRRLARDADELLWPLVDLARADIAASAYPQPEKIDELAERLRATLGEPDRVRPRVVGEDVMQALGIGPGPELGRIKRRLEELVLEGTVDPDRDALLAYIRSHGDELRNG